MEGAIRGLRIFYWTDALLRKYELATIFEVLGRGTATNFLKDGMTSISKLTRR